MKFFTPTKSFTSNLLMMFLLFIPIIIPGKRPFTNELADNLFKNQTSTLHSPHVHKLLQVVNDFGSGHEVVSPAAAPAVSVTTRMSAEFTRFIDRVTNGQEGVVRGIYVEGILALQVVQQPDKEWKYVSGDLGDATEFQNASKNGIIGLLAHNFLSGRLFFDLRQGENIGVIYGDGAVRYYQVQGEYQYQKLTPSDLSSKLVDLSTGNVVSSGQVFERFYDGTDHLTLQTCLEKDGLSTWGLYFVVALPVNAAN